MRRVHSYIALVCVCTAAVALAGCGTQKNSGITRAYHNVTTRYNVLFNARESYKRGIANAENNRQYDYTQRLPIFLYGDNSVAMAIAGDMEAAAAKASKAVNLHSIKVKPHVGRSGMSPAEREFYSKREFNKWMDDCYLIIGKSYVYTGQYLQASQTFNFMETEFPGEESIYEARLWRAKTFILENNLTEAGRLLTELRDDSYFPDDRALTSELNATIADLYIRQSRYADAADYLNRAAGQTRHKKTEMRYRYILAQLHLEQKDYFSALEEFRNVIRMNPPYEMSFNATVSSATASQNSGTDISEIKRQLSRMLRDSKNTEYHDQIYFTLAEIELSEGNTDMAIDYFQKSANASATNIPQRTKSYLTLGNLFYERREYAPAQAYFDSAMVNMQPDYSDYITISAKAKNLDGLVKNLNTVTFQDSVQRIARMTEAERNRIISGIISDLQLKEQKEREAEAMRAQQYYSTAGRRNTLPDPTSQSQWYFYNPTMVSQGINEFEMRWGRRNLEDNWRRKNRGTAEMGIAADSDEANEQTAGAGTVQDIYTPAYYLQNIPLTDSMMTVSNRMIEESLYAAGYIYNNDIGEYGAAAEQYEDLIRRYPQSEYTVPSYYYLHLLYNKLGKTAEAENYKNMLIAKAPESVYANILLDPEYLDKIAQQKGESEQLYEQTYNLYNNADYQSVVQHASDALERFPDDVLAPLFAYLKAVSTGKLAGTDEAMREEMRKITDNYPETEIAANAQNIIDLIDGENPEMKQVEQVERAKAMYDYSENDPHFFVWLVNRTENLNQLWFDLQNFATDNFINDRLIIERTDFNDRQTLLITRGFTDFKHTQEFYLKFTGNTEITKNILYETTQFIISEKNYTVMENNKNIEEYIQFFKTKYLQQQ